MSHEHTHEKEILKARQEKIEKIKALGTNPYPYKFTKTHNSLDVKEGFREDSQEDFFVTTAGRVMSFRNQGKTTFAHIQDEYSRVQVYFRQDNLGEKCYDIVKLLDIGDYIGVKGKVFKTHKGEITVLANEFELLSKNMRPLPIAKEKIDEDGNKVVYDAFTDKEERYRKRYLDLIVNPEVKDVFRKRLEIVLKIRQFMDRQGFLEVETPILQPIKGGAAAKPFVTHHNVLDMDLFLRIAPELYLKRLISGGFEKVYEIGKNFRNEGVSYKHNPEFTMMELYQAYADYNDMMDLSENLITTVVKDVCDCLKITFKNKEIDFTGPWKRVTMGDAIKEYANIDAWAMSEQELRELLKTKGIEPKEYVKKGELVSIIFEEFVEHKLINPTFIIDYPIEISPLTKIKRDNSNVVERFELFINGWEIGNAYSELNDPAEQLKRFEAQIERSEKGDEEAEMLDEDFVNMLEIGMPPTGGLGIGIDRLVMIILNQQSIRDIIFFPHMRPISK